MSGLIDPTMSVLSQAIDGLTSSQAVISSNLANIDTPGYQPQTVDFETALQQEVANIWSPPGNALPPSSGVAANVAMEQTDARHFSAGGATGLGSAATSSGTNESIRNDGNKVDLETEMTALTQTQIKYEANAHLLTAKFNQLYTVLGGH
jgi:flagellar basal-body rod protein FlgB